MKVLLEVLTNVCFRWLNLSSRNASFADRNVLSSSMMSHTSLVGDLYSILAPGSGMLKNHIRTLELFTQDFTVESRFRFAVDSG